ncbi:MAG: hypothetical protein O7A07_02825, partial [Acidobacteria bacterium]|nr:hypothetical protein [Acidobacteriota bacterium]
VLLDVMQQKHFSAWPKYLTYSSIGIAFLFAHATTHTPRVLRRVAAVLVACLLAVQLTGVNWGETRCNVRPREFSYREVARMVKESSEGASLVMVSVGWGRGDPWSYVYELDPDTEVVFFHWSTVTAELGRLASGYDEVWFLRATDRSISKREEKAWGEVLQASGHREVMSLAKGLILKAN